MNFDYDKQKSKTNLEKHGISLGEAVLLWSVPSVEIEARTADEPRFMMVGKLKGKFYSCIFTTRGETIRLISARRSRKEEEEIYHDHIKREDDKG